MSLRLQINFLLILIILGLGLSSLWFFKAKQDEVIMINMKSQANAITTLVAEDIAKIVYLDDPDVATDIIRRIQKVEDIASAYFFDLKNKPILSINPRKDKTIQSSYAINTSIEFQGVQIGHAHFVFNTLEVEVQKQKLNQFAIFIFIGLLLSVAIFARYFDGRFSSRLSALSAAIRKATEEKDFNIQLPTRGQDEIAQTINDFNQLVSMVKDKTKTLKFQAKHDVLTGLYNRHHLLQRIEESFHSDQNHALCYIDLDHFKVVNDTTGHINGDHLLQQLSEKMVGYCLQSDNTLLGRIGGDEFILLIEDTPRKKAKFVVKQLQHVIRQFRFKVGERDFRIGASIGMIYYTQTQIQALSAEDLLSAADMACYQAKAEGRNKIVDFDIDDIRLEQKYHDMSMVSQIYNGLEQDWFEIYLQPIVSSSDTTNINRFEALLRLKDSQGKIVSPAQFIHVAEQYGLSKRLDQWVVNEVLRKLDDHPEFLATVENISINLSAELLMETSSAEEIYFLFEKYQLPYQKISFEITETAPITNLDAAKAFIMFFQEKGVSFSLDDFGTGMASFNYLSELMVNTLKIDGSFIKKMTSDPIMLEMVKAMYQIGQITNAKVVAEQVEDEATLKALQALGVDYIQGYHIAKPAPFADFLPPNNN